MFLRDTCHLQDNAENYVIGAYHTCYIGEILNDRYVIIKKISMTQYSSLWSARDVLHSIFVTIKIFKSAPNYNEIALEEVEKLQFIHKKSKEEKWLYHIFEQKESLYLRQKIPDNENFCVKFFEKVFELVYPLRSSWKPFLYNLRGSWHITRRPSQRRSLRKSIINRFLLWRSNE